MLTPLTPHLEVVESDKPPCLAEFGTGQSDQGKFGKIIYLYGPSSVGKTSICRVVKEIEPDMIVEGIDAAMDRRYLQIISKIESFKRDLFDRYVVLSKCLEDDDIPTFLQGEKAIFKPLSTSEERKDAKAAGAYVSIIEELFSSAFHREEAQKELFKRVFQLSASGKDVIVDAVECGDLLKYKATYWSSFPVLVALVHCSFAKLAEHKEERNRLALQSGEEQEARFGTYPFLQFTDFLKPQERAEEPFLHSIDRATVTEIYNKHLREELRFRPVPSDTEETLQRRRNSELDILFSRLGLQENFEGNVPLTSREYFDVEVDTGKLTSLQGAQKILRQAVKAQ